jgi:hypothetical protein
MTIEEQLKAVPVGQLVTLIRHFYGKQSDSMVGHVFFFRDPNKELMVNFDSNGTAIIFGVSDIKSINSFGGTRIPDTLIRLKSPSDYESEKYLT